MAEADHWLRSAPPGELLVEGGLLLRRWSAQNAPAMVRAILESQEHLAPWMPWAAAYDQAESAGFLAMIEKGWVARTDFGWGILDGDEIVGSVGLHARIADGRLELGYWTHVDRIGQGIAPRAAVAALGAAFALPEVGAVEVHHDQANVRSARVPEVLGFRQVGTVTSDGGERDDEGLTVVWEMLREDWDARE